MLVVSKLVNDMPIVGLTMFYQEHYKMGMYKQHDNLVKHNTYIGGRLIVYKTRVLNQYYPIRASMALIS
jgi:hypothetical protein